MKIVLIGAQGDVGSAAFEELSKRHDVVTAGRSHGEVFVDLAESGSIRDVYQTIGPFDALVCCAGAVQFAPLEDFTEESFMIGLTNKVMGQVNLVLSGLDHNSDNGSFTLTSGVLDRDPIRVGASAATANGALAGFVKGSAIGMPRGVRINVVSPGLLDVSEPKYGHWFPGHEPVASERVGRAYAKSVEGHVTGQVIIVE